MKRGRPNIRDTIQTKIIEVLSKTNTPINISTICKHTSKEARKPTSWNTVEKYLHELVQVGKIQAIQLPHSKIEGKKGLTVYILKK